MSQEYYKPLDALRGLLALAVVLYHAQWAGVLSSNGFAQNGYLAVDVFFCLSGFLMFTLYRSISTGAEAKTFMMKRFARLYPLHFFTLIIGLLYAVARLIAHKAGLPVLEAGEAIPLTAGSHENLGTFLSNLTLTQGLGLHDRLSYNGPSWSISTEFFTYIIFAAVMIVFPIKKTRHFVAIGSISALIYIGLSAIRPNLDITYDLGLIRCFGGFGAGIVAAAMFQKTRSFYARQSKLAATAIELSVLAAFLIWFCMAEGKTTFLVAPFMVLLIITFANDKGALSSFMNLPIFQYLGKISYSVYLNHALIAVVLDVVIGQLFGGREALSPLAGDMMTLTYLAIVLVASHITYHMIEKPVGAFLRKRLLRANPDTTRTPTKSGTRIRQV